MLTVRRETQGLQFIWSLKHAVRQVVALLLSKNPFLDLSLLSVIYISGEKTNGWMGVGEMFVGVCVCGLIFTVFSGQPLLILGHTGPLLVFEEAMYGVGNFHV